MKDRSAFEQLMMPGAIRPYFQPIIRIGGDLNHLHGFECLTRGPAGTNFESAQVLFDYVRLKREEIQFDRACISAAFEELEHMPSEVRYSVNVHASTLGRDAGFCQFLEQSGNAGVPLERLTIEIVEHAPPWDNLKFLQVLDSIRALGIRIALDDVGLGQSNFKMILDVCPDYLKIDRYFIHGAHTDPKRRAVIRSIQQLGMEFGAAIVAEGVENIEDLILMHSLGITLIQGYYFSKPLTAAEVLEGKGHPHSAGITALSPRGDLAAT